MSNYCVDTDPQLYCASFKTKKYVKIKDYFYNKSLVVCI